METLSSAGKQSWLPWFLRGILLFGLLILFARVVDLQVIRGNYFRVLAEGNRIRRVPIEAPRGKIYARGGEELVGNIAIKKRVVFDPKEGFKKEAVFDSDTPEEDLITEWKRDYKLGAIFSHVSGYLGESREAEVGKIKAQCPEKGAKKLGSILGRTGLEEVYDCSLLGYDGEELVEVDASGKRIRTLGKREPIAGEDLKTHIHFGLQKKVNEIMKDLTGAVVVSDSKGQILALVSSPSYNPNMLIAGSDKKAITDLFSDPMLPMFNRAMGGLYHPGSVFKPIVGIAALEEGKIDEKYTYEDKGYISINDFSYKNWYFTQYGGTEGSISLSRALARSTDTYFYKVGELLGANAIHDWAQKFGLGEKTGIDLTGEVGGLVPSPDWKLKTKGERWFLGNTYHYSIGQGDLAVTPLAMDRVISAIANGGELCRPRIAGEPECRKLGISQEHLNTVISGMKDACSTGGTGYTFFNFEEASKKRDEGAKVQNQSSNGSGGIKVACKTGTAETSEDDTTHAWFTAFAPIEDPEIVVTVLIERGGEGSKVAGPVARSIFNYWYGIPETPVTISPTPTSTE